MHESDPVHNHSDLTFPNRDPFLRLSLVLLLSAGPS